MTNPFKTYKPFQFEPLLMTINLEAPLTCQFSNLIVQPISSPILRDKRLLFNSETCLTFFRTFSILLCSFNQIELILTTLHDALFLIKRLSPSVSLYPTNQYLFGHIWNMHSELETHLDDDRTHPNSPSRTSQVSCLGKFH